MQPVTSALSGATRPLAETFDVALLDLDGVVYIGPEAVPGAAEALASARCAGMQLAFVTNNAARPPSVVATHLCELGIEAQPDEVITSAQAAARYLADRLPAGAHVLVVGTTGLYEALRERGLVPVVADGEQVTAIVQGYSPDLTWKQLAEGAVAINRGALWVATNVDPTVPSPRGPLPGNGSTVAALRHATHVDPVVTGKPDPAMHRETLIRTNAQRPLVVGDRLDTDIEGANAVGCPSLLVLTGVTTPVELIAAAPALRPAYLAADLGGLLVAHPKPEVGDGVARCRGWEAVRTATGAVLRSDAGLGRRDAGLGRDDRAGPDELDALRTICAVVWAGDDWAEGSVVQAGDGDVSARAALERLGLSD